MCHSPDDKPDKQGCVADCETPPGTVSGTVNTDGTEGNTVQVEESLYQSLGMLSTSMTAFYGCGGAQGLWGPCLTSNLQYMDHQHLRMMLRHLLLPFVRICPPQHRSHLVTSCLSTLAIGTECCPQRPNALLRLLCLSCYNLR